MRRRTLAHTLVCLALASGPAGWAAELPAGLTTRQSLTEDDRRAVREFSLAQSEALASADAAKSQTAREDLLAPMRTAVSVDFRLAYSEALTPTLAKLATGADERVAFNALRVAGALATQGAVDAIRAALADARPAVRYGGAFAARRSLDEIASKRSLDAAQAPRLIEALSGSLAKETEPGVLEGLISAFDASGSDKASRSAALASMCEGIGAQAASFADGKHAGSPTAWALAFQRAVKVAQSALLEQGKIGALDEALAKGAASMCGRALGHVVARLASFRPGESHDEETASLADLASAAEGTLIFIDTNLSKRQSLAQSIRAAFPDAAKVRAEAEKWIGAKGLLTQAPYGFKPMTP